MSPELAFLQALNGISFGALLFILAAGLSLIFGMMDVVNLAHGAFYMLGAYIALSVVRTTGSFWVALVAVPLALGALGLVVEPLLLRRLRGRHLDQVLITVGVALVITDLIRLKPDWGAEVRTLPPPDALAGSIAILGNDYPVYRLFVSALGVDTDRLFAVTYSIGAALAGLAGVVAAPVLGLQPGMDVEALVLSLIVVVVGGLGTLGGAQVGAALVGPADTFGKVFVPQFALFFIFAIMALVLLLRPSGLLGRIRVIR